MFKLFKESQTVQNVKEGADSVKEKAKEKAAVAKMKAQSKVKKAPQPARTEKGRRLLDEHIVTKVLTDGDLLALMEQMLVSSMRARQYARAILAKYEQADKELQRTIDDEVKRRDAELQAEKAEKAEKAEETEEAASTPDDDKDELPGWGKPSEEDPGAENVKATKPAASQAKTTKKAKTSQTKKAKKPANQTAGRKAS